MFDRAASVNSDNVGVERGKVTESLPYKSLDTAGSGQNVAEKTNLTDKAPTLTEMFYAGGSFTGAIVGGVFDDWGGYGFTCTVIALISIAFALVYALVVFAPECGKD